MHCRAARSILIRDGRIIDPSAGLDEVAGLYIESGRISRVVRLGESWPLADLVLEASGLIVAPGFVDVHTHLRFPGFGGKETVASATASAVRGGFTTLCAMANTQPVVDAPTILVEV